MELRDEIAERALGITETPRHFGQRLPFHNDRAEGLVTSLQRRLRIEEELSAPAVVHDQPSQLSLLYWRKNGGQMVQSKPPGQQEKRADQRSNLEIPRRNV
jgi:hypothetical protein